MKNTLFIEAVKSIYPISKQIQKELDKRLKRKSGKAGDLIVKIGEVNDTLYFIESGMVRSYYFKEENENEEKTEVTSWIINEFNFIYIPHSFISQTSSLEAVELLEDSEFICLKHKDLYELYNTFPEANYVGRILTEISLIMYDERVRFLRMMSAQKRHEIFQTSYPEIYERAPLKYIASFLGLTPETLSRVRSKKSK
jgi:CRP-like cAMP-binding protein